MISEVGNRNQFGVDRCPICGKPDWCVVSSDGQYNYHICMRTADFSHTMSVVDGGYYVYLRQSSKGFPIFEEVNQHAARKNIKHDESKFSKPEIKVKAPEEMIPLLPEDKLNQIYRYFLSRLVLESYHKDMLLKDGWTLEQIDSSGIKSMPPFDSKRNSFEGLRNPTRYELMREINHKFGDVTGVPGFYYRKSKTSGKYYLATAAKEGMLLPVYNIEQEVVRLRIRLDHVEKNKYRNFSSYYADQETGKNVYHNGCQASNQLTFFYDHSFQPMNFHLTYFTEGWKKAYLIKEILGHVGVSMPGVNNASLITDDIIEKLKGMGVTYVVMAFDADKVKNNHVKEAEKRLFSVLSKHFIVGVADWDIDLGKGIDDYLLQGKKPAYTFYEQSAG